MKNQSALVEPMPKGVISLPTEDDLPYSDGMAMGSQRHVLQREMLINILWLFWKDRENVFIGSNMFVHFSEEQVRNRDFHGPDVFIVKDVPQRERKSWVVCQESKGPDMVIELLSESTAVRDKNEKKRIYQNQLRVPEYFWFDPFSRELAGFRLQGSKYQSITPDSSERLISQELQLALVRWQGSYHGVNAPWLRWETLEGDLLLTPEEAAVQAQQQATQAQQQAAQVQQQNAELEAQLRRYRERFGELPD